jgi:molybdopterin/thiamine biosynthesis adenylyltransferase
MLASAAADAGVPLVTAAVAGWTAWLSTVFPGDPDPSDLMRSAGAGGDAQETLGVPAPAVTALAGIQAAEAIRLLAGEEPALRRKMLVMDLSQMSFETMSLG